ncbi:hypothetical protein F4820DRAFT_324008 [Hypoxylon rubiginosum]|uniref:Uncharacterized protein n=1 Tax=Hypoxylon rubiginosum TaxID=110542 RepID=A0ACB9Z114_9PEZI|nr:hypothetical protein F4820DRAFT_324008 [Hypoxylon rubiginosum]
MASDGRHGLVCCPISLSTYTSALPLRLRLSRWSHIFLDLDTLKLPLGSFEFSHHRIQDCSYFPHTLLPNSLFHTSNLLHTSYFTNTPQGREISYGPHSHGGFIDYPGPILVVSGNSTQEFASLDHMNNAKAIPFSLLVWRPTADISGADAGYFNTYTEMLALGSYS